MENELNKWIKQKCAHFTMIPFGLEDLGEMTEVSKFKKGEDIITQYMIESDHSYIFAEIDEGETTWKLLSRIPDEIIRQGFTKPPRPMIASKEKGILLFSNSCNTRFFRNSNWSITSGKADSSSTECFILLTNSGVSFS